MNNRRSNNGFTLPEVMMALVIGGFVLAVMSSLLVQGFMLWKDYTCQWYVSQQSRLVRERILRGTFGTGGLRSATEEKLSWQLYGKKGVLTYALPQTNDVYYSIWSTTGGLHCTKMGWTEHALSGLHGHGRCARVGSDQVCSCLTEFQYTNGQLSCCYEVSMASGKRTYTAKSNIKMTILN